MFRDSPQSPVSVTIVYDGECPVCRSYVTLYRLRNLAGKVQLFDARSKHPLVGEIERRGLDLNKGMVVEFEGNFFYGVDATHVLAILGSTDTVFNSVNHLLFRHPQIAGFIYPCLVIGRRLLLFMLGKSLIANSD